MLKNLLPRMLSRLISAKIWHDKRESMTGIFRTTEAVRCAREANTSTGGVIKKGITMNDRFRCRVAVKQGIEWQIYDANGIQFKDDGEIWVRVIQQTGTATFTAWFQVDGENVILEQCTGLKDKDGKLIYEGDVVVGSWNTKLIVFWDVISSSYRVKPLEDKCGDREIHYYTVIATSPDGSIECINYEIIGNIHEEVKTND